MTQGGSNVARGGGGRGYEALRNGAAALRVCRSLIGMAGADTFDFLHRMTTNDLLSLPDGEQRRTVVVSEKGRVIDLVSVIRTGPDALLVGSPGAGRAVAEWLGKFIIMDDVRVSGVADAAVVEAVYGPGAEAVAGQFLRARPAGPPDQGRADRAPAVDAALVREDLGGIPGYLLVPRTPPAAAEGPPDPAGVEAGPAQSPAFPGTAAAAEADFETVRIEECVPVLGRELGPDVNALEAGLKPFISFTKGCYIGQEVIARIDTYRKLQNILTLFIIPGYGGSTLEPGAVRRGDAVAGRITSTAWSPQRSAWIGLGYRRIRPAAGGLEFLPGKGGEAVPCRVLLEAMPGYEEYETEE